MARRGGRGPEVARTSTGRSLWELSTLPAGAQPPCSRRRVRDGTERRRGQTARRVSSPRPGPLPTEPAAPPGARVRDAPTLVLGAQSERSFPRLSRPGSQRRRTGAGRPRRIRRSFPLSLAKDRNGGTTGGTATRGL